MPELLERQRTSFGLSDVTAAPVMLARVDAGALTTQGLYFGSEPEPYQWSSARPAPWLADAAQSLARLSTLGPGWDGHRASPVDRSVLDVAWAALQRLSALVAVPPAVVPTVSGGLALEWHWADFDLEIELGIRSCAVCYDDAEGQDVEGPLAEHIDLVAAVLGRLR